MEELQRKQRLRKILYSLPVLILLLLLLGAVGRGAWGIFVVERESARQAEALAHEATALQARNSELAGNIERLGTEEGEREALREKFNVSEEGEEFIVIVDERREESAEVSEEPGWLEKIWSAILGS